MRPEDFSEGGKCGGPPPADGVAEERDDSEVLDTGLLLAGFFPAPIFPLAVAFVGFGDGGFHVSFAGGGVVAGTEDGKHRVARLDHPCVEFGDEGVAWAAVGGIGDCGGGLAP